MDVRLRPTHQAIIRILFRLDDHLLEFLPCKRLLFNRACRQLILFLGYRELNGIHSRFGPQIVHPCFQTGFPGLEMHGCQFGVVRILHEEVQGLRLIDEIASMSRHVNDVFHAHFPNRLVEVFQFLRNRFNVLNGTIGPHDVLFHVIVPKAQLH